MRASILVLGPMLARAGEATVSLPGGCAIGNRPIDLHLKALEAIGAEIEIAAGYVKAIAPGRAAVGRALSLPGRVGRRDRERRDGGGDSRRAPACIENAAREPEIVDLCRCSSRWARRSTGIGTETLTIEGRDRLHGATYAVMPDRIEAGSYACAAAITGGSLDLVGARRRATCARRSTRWSRRA